MSDSFFLEVKPGDRITSSYRVIKRLGIGSMGAVYACEHLGLDNHQVAVKVLFPDVLENETALRRFHNEVVASYAVSHQNVVRTYEYFNHDDLLGLAMEYVDGGDLADKLHHEGLQSIERCTEMLLQLSAGVEAIHRAGIIHRDLKPENILITSEGLVKIADFGIARTHPEQNITEHGGVVGTLSYVSPEYILKSEVDERSDIYAIGVLAYEMLTGVSPFQGDSIYETMKLRLESQPTPVHYLRPDCPVALGELIMQAMAADVECRIQSAEVLRCCLEEACNVSCGRSYDSVPALVQTGMSPSGGSGAQTLTAVARNDFSHVVVNRSTVELHPGENLIAQIRNSQHHDLFEVETIEIESQYGCLESAPDPWVLTGGEGFSEQGPHGEAQRGSKRPPVLWIDLMNVTAALMVVLGVGTIFG